jgi:hypothetical protein
VTVVSATPTQAAALRAFVIACLNLDDESEPITPAPFDASNVIWSDRDHPRPPRYAMLREVAFVEQNPEVMHETINAGEVDEDLLEWTRTIAEWTVSLQLCTKMTDSAPTLAENAGRLLRRVSMRVLSDLADPMRAVGCAWRRSGQILPLPRIARDSQWESRAAIDLTFCVGEAIVVRPGWIETASGTGTLDPAATEAFEHDHEDPL